MDRGTWLARAHGVTESDMTERLNTHVHAHTHILHQAPCWTPTLIKAQVPVRKEPHDQGGQTNTETNC